MSVNPLVNDIREKLETFHKRAINTIDIRKHAQNYKVKFVPLLYHDVIFKLTYNPAEQPYKPEIFVWLDHSVRGQNW